VDIAPGRWEILGAYTGWLGLAYSLCYDRIDTPPANMFVVKPAQQPRRQSSRAAIQILKISRTETHFIAFEGIVRQWNDRPCEPRLVRGDLATHLHLGYCVIGDITPLPAWDDS